MLINSKISNSSHEYNIQFIAYALNGDRQLLKRFYLDCSEYPLCLQMIKYNTKTIKIVPTSVP